ncbi:MAG TPA: SH3 domain-containing protein [Steroidobacteraceae bacterium]
MRLKLSARLPAPLLLLCALAAPAARAETLYVIEQLVVAINSAPDGSGERVASIKSGDRVEVLERSGAQIHVRTAGGKDGWIRVSYLSADEPLRPRLAERTAEVARLREDVSRLQAQLGAARTTAGAAPSAGAAVSPSAAPAPAATAAESGSPPQRALFVNTADDSPRAPDESPRRVWPWALGAALLALCVGFALGALVLDRHIRRKYGGLRIY